MPKPRIVLNMICKDEAPVIERCLASVLPFIDAWAIIDTGSTDNTPELVQKTLGHLPGTLEHQPWVDFATNRNQALDLAVLFGDYALLIDADDELQANSKGFPDLEHDAYSAEYVYDDMRYQRPLLVHLDAGYRWEGVLHEGLYGTGTTGPTLPLADVKVIVHRDGNRSTLSDAEKYGADAEVLEAALAGDPENLRYRFYLAQSYRDSGQLAKARDAYGVRAAMGGWDEEVWYSLFQYAILSERMGSPETPLDYLDAYQNRPTRAEPLVELARYYRERENWPLAHLYAAQAVHIPKPADQLFLDAPTYTWRALDEYSIAAYWVGDYAASREACEQLLASPDLPDREVPRVEANHSFAVAGVS